MSRRPEIDTVRVIAMASVFAAHAAQPFNPWDTWHVQAAERSKWLGELVLFLAPWVMPTFVLIAGASAWHSLEKRSTREYLHERVTRLVVPLAAGILLLVPPQVYFDRRLHGKFAGSFVSFYPHFFDGIYPSGNFTWAHLWFLGVLALLAVVTLPLFQWLRGAAGHRAMRTLARICEPPGAIMLLAIPVVVARALLWALFPHARPIVTDWSNRTTLLPMFVYGYMLAGEPRLMQAVDRQWKIALGAAIVFSAGMFAWAWPGSFTDRFPVPFSVSYVSIWSVYALGGVAWSIALLGATRAWRRPTNRIVGQASAMLNPFYMLHQTIIVVFAFYLIRITTNPLLTYTVLFASASVATIAAATVARRWRTTRVLLGARRAPSTDHEVSSHDRDTRQRGIIHGA